MHGGLEGQHQKTGRQLPQGRQVSSVFKFPATNCCTLITQAETDIGQIDSGCLSVTRNTRDCFLIQSVL